MQPIYSPPVPFHTINIDFILALPLTTDHLDSVMSVTCKYSKRITLAPGKSTWKALEWASALLERLELGDRCLRESDHAKLPTNRTRQLPN